MTNKQALEVLRDYQDWRRSDCMDPCCPPQPDAFIVGEAIDVAITMLESLVSKVDKDYYGG